MDEDCRVVVLSANGKHFTAGLDLSDMGDLIGTVMSDKDVSRKFRVLQDLIGRYQDSFTSIEQVGRNLKKIFLTRSLCYIHSSATSRLLQPSMAVVLEAGSI